MMEIIFGNAFPRPPVDHVFELIVLRLEGGNNEPHDVTVKILQFPPEIIIIFKQ